MQAVVGAQLELHEKSAENTLRKNLRGDMFSHANEYGAWRIFNEDHYVILEESGRREAFDFLGIFEDDER